MSWCKAGGYDKENEQTLLDDDDVVEEGGVIDLVISDGFHLQASRTAVQDNSLVKRRVVLRLSVGWFGGYITRKSQERTINSHVYDYRVQLEEDQSARSMRLPLDRCTTDPSAVLGAWALLEQDQERQAEGTPENAGVGRLVARTSSSGRTLRPNVRNTELQA